MHQRPESMRELVALYNELAAPLGLPPVRRFADRRRAVERIGRLEERHANGEAAPQPAPVPAENPATGAPPLRWYTERFNELVPQAQKLGLKVKVHTSLFESRAKGAKQLAALQAAIAAAEQNNCATA